MRKFSEAQEGKDQVKRKWRAVEVKGGRGAKRISRVLNRHVR